MLWFLLKFLQYIKYIILILEMESHESFVEATSNHNPRYLSFPNNWDYRHGTTGTQFL
jgi:hypothetical protein